MATGRVSKTHRNPDRVYLERRNAGHFHGRICGGLPSRAGSINQRHASRESVPVADPPGLQRRYLKDFDFRQRYRDETNTPDRTKNPWDRWHERTDRETWRRFSVFFRTG